MRFSAKIFSLNLEVLAAPTVLTGLLRKFSRHKVVQTFSQRRFMGGHLSQQQFLWKNVGFASSLRKNVSNFMLRAFLKQSRQNNCAKGAQYYRDFIYLPVLRCIILCLLITTCAGAFGADKPFLKLMPKTLFFEENYKNEEIRKTFEGRENRLQYFLDEITNYPEDKPEFFFDYINPEISQRDFIIGKSSVYKRILRLKNIELSNQERRAAHDIDRFIATNYKTERLPSKAYLTNPHLPQPLTLAQLTTLAFNAIPNDDMHALRALIENYNLVNIKDGMGNSLLVHAIMLGKNNIARVLIHHGADLNSVNSYGVTPLMEAVRSGNLEAAHMLIKYGCNMRKKDSEKKSALDYALGNDKMYALISNSMRNKR